jgi:hypothetical protein
MGIQKWTRDRINSECESYLDEFEGDWLEPSQLIKVATVIRDAAGHSVETPVAYQNVLLGAAKILESNAKREVGVMIDH